MSFKFKRIGLIAAIPGGALAAYFWLSGMKPPPETRETQQLDLLVEAMPLEASDVDFSVTSQGVVRPLTETIVSAEVAGAIVRVSPKFVAGGVFDEDEVLLRIDPTNYEVALEQAEALVRQRQIEFDGAEKLKSQGYRAETEYASAAAALASARAELVRARRNLERTYIRLPYAGMVRSKEVDIGQYVNVGSRLGVTFATGTAEVRLPLTDRDLAFVDLPTPGALARDGEPDGPRVTLSAEYRGKMASWPARIARTEGVVDDRNRVTYAVARVDDPYGLESGNDSMPLPMGTFVAARIDGLTVEDVIRVPRQALRGNSELMFIDVEGRLRIRTVDLLRTDRNYAYLAGGAEPGERISLTAIESPVNGMRVRVDGEEGGEESGEEAGSQVASGNAAQ
jgi:RND family efflux transporter MFP subunit